METAGNSTPSHQLVELSREECLERLAETSFGRVVLSSPSGSKPMIRPVNYVFDAGSGSVVFRSGAGSKFHALTRSANAQFEIDAIDAGTQTAWSVIISGPTEQITAPAEVHRLEALGLVSWAPGQDPRWIRIRARTVSGRRIASDVSGDTGQPHEQ